MSGSSTIECDVVVNGTLVGTLTQVGHEVRTTFAYDKDYLANGGKSIAPAMPTSKQKFCYPGLPPFFSNLLSEGWLRLHHDAAVATARGSDEKPSDCQVTGFDILAFLGNTSLRGGQITPRQKLPADVWEALNKHRVRMNASRTILSGVQPKLFVKRDGDRFVSCSPEESTHIAKGNFPADDEKAQMFDIVGNEFLASKIARVLTPNDTFPNIERADLCDLGPSIVIERFDLSGNGQPYRVLDFGQLLDIPPERRNDACYSEITKFIRSHANKDPDNHFQTDAADVKLFAQRLCRNIMLGNLDTHLKNFSLIGINGKWKLTPDYDVVHSRIYSDSTLALHITPPPKTAFSQGDSEQAIEQRHKYLPKIGDFKGKVLCRLLDSFELPHDTQAEIIRGLLNNAPAALREIEAAEGVDSKIKASMARSIQARCRETFEPALALLEGSPSRPARPARLTPTAPQPKAAEPVG